MRSVVARVSVFSLGVVMLACSISTQLLAGGDVAPEIDGGSVSAGLAAASAAVLILRSRRRTK